MRFLGEGTSVPSFEDALQQIVQSATPQQTADALHPGMLGAAEFVEARGDVRMSERYLVSALCGHVSSYTSLAVGLRSFRRFLLSRSSGFLVQVSPRVDGVIQDASAANVALLQCADELTADTLARVVG